MGCKGCIFHFSGCFWGFVFDDWTTTITSQEHMIVAFTWADLILQAL
jgi:hypothetical protein